MKQQLHLCENLLGGGIKTRIGVVAAVQELSRGENGLTSLGLTERGEKHQNIPCWKSGWVLGLRWSLFVDVT